MAEQDSTMTFSINEAYNSHIWPRWISQSNRTWMAFWAILCWAPTYPYCFWAWWRPQAFDSPWFDCGRAVCSRLYKHWPVLCWRCYNLSVFSFPFIAFSVYDRSIRSCSVRRFYWRNRSILFATSWFSLKQTWRTSGWWQPDTALEFMEAFLLRWEYSVIQELSGFIYLTPHPVALS